MLVITRGYFKTIHCSVDMLYVYHLTNPEILSALWSWNGSPCNPMPFMSFFFFQNMAINGWWISSPNGRSMAWGVYHTVQKLCRTPPVPSSLRPFPSPATWRTEYLATPQKNERDDTICSYIIIYRPVGGFINCGGYGVDDSALSKFEESPSWRTQLPPPQTWHCQWQVHCQLQVHCVVDKPHCPEATLSNRCPNKNQLKWWTIWLWWGRKLEII